MRKLIGFILGGTLAVLLTRYHILDGGEIHATSYSVDALKLGLWSEAAKLLSHGAALKLGLALAIGGALGSAIQYLFERQVHVGRH